MSMPINLKPILTSKNNCISETKNIIVKHNKTISEYSQNITNRATYNNDTVDFSVLQSSKLTPNKNQNTKPIVFKKISNFFRNIIKFSKTNKDKQCNASNGVSKIYDKNTGKLKKEIIYCPNDCYYTDDIEKIEINYCDDGITKSSSQYYNKSQKLVYKFSFYQDNKYRFITHNIYDKNSGKLKQKDENVSGHLYRQCFYDDQEKLKKEISYDTTQKPRMKYMTGLINNDYYFENFHHKIINYNINAQQHIESLSYDNNNKLIYRKLTDKNGTTIEEKGYDSITRKLTHYHKQEGNIITVRNYDTDGHLRYSLSTTKDGKFTKSIEYHKNDILNPDILIPKETTEFDNTTKHKIKNTLFYKTGKPCLIEKYDKNTGLVDSMIVYDKNGKIQYKGKWEYNLVMEALRKFHNDIELKPTNK